MPKCKNDPKRTYKGTEPSPKGLGHCAHSEKVGKKMKGKDGNQWIITETKKGVKRWSKIKVMKKKNIKSNNLSNINNKTILKTKSLTEKDENIIKKLLLNKSKELVDVKHKNIFHRMLTNINSISPQNEKIIIDILYKNILLKKDKNKNFLVNILSSKSITIKDEEKIKNILSKNVKLKKDYDEKLIRKLYTLKKKKKKISIDKSVTLYDKFSPDEKVKCKLDKGDYNIYVSKFIKFKNTFTTSMIII